MPRIAYSPTNKFVGAKPNYLWDINLQYSRSRGEFIVYDNKAVQLMIANVLFTIPGERVFEPEFGSNLPFLLQEPMNEITAWKIENESYIALQRWIPYILVDRRNALVIPNYDAGRYSVRLPYLELNPASFFNRASTFDADLYAVR